MRRHWLVTVQQGSAPRIGGVKATPVLWTRVCWTRRRAERLAASAGQTPILAGQSRRITVSRLP